jgi:hypothetical protein
MPWLISCCVPATDLQLVPEQAGLSHVFPSQTLLPHVSEVHVVEAIDIDASDIDISEVIDCDAFPDAIVSSLSENLPNAATEAPRTKTLATPNQTFFVFIFIIPHFTIRH